jgi:hypothetical protein
MGSRGPVHNPCGRRSPIYRFRVRGRGPAKWGHVLGPAARVSEALALIDAAACDAALLDVTLEHGETVYAVAERLRAKRIPFVFVTGSDDGFGERYDDAPVLRSRSGRRNLIGACGC